MKIPDVGFPQGTHPTTYEFYGWTRSVLNEGRYQMRILNSAPTWVANDGEVLLVQTDTERALYAYITDGWYNLNWDTSGAVRGVPTGTILPFAGAAAKIPAGYLLCNGAAASRTTYATLFDVLGTAYGVGDGVTTFNLPNFSDKLMMGKNTDVLGYSSPYSYTMSEATINSNFTSPGGAGGPWSRYDHVHTLPYTTVNFIIKI